MSAKTKRTPAQPWTEEKKQAAVNSHTYIKIGDKRGSLLLSGAPKQWKTNPTLTYIPSLRVVGTAADLRRVLADVPNIDRLVAGGYNGTSAVGALKAQYEGEVAAQKAFSKSQSKKTTKSVTREGRSISEYAAMVEEASVKPEDSRTAGRRSPKGKSKSRSKSPKRKSKGRSKSPKSRSKSPKRKTKPLADKIAALSANKVMDVSNLKADGSGAKTMDVPGPKSKKMRVLGYSIVSDNKRGINNAAKQLEDQGLVDAWVAVKAQPKTSPKKRSRSRSRSPASVLPMSPSSTRTASPGGVAMPSLPSVRVPTIGSPRGSPRI